jgi:hypothetical protein
LAKKHQEEKSAFEADGLVIKKENGFANFFFMYLLPKLGPPTVFYDEVKYIEKRARAQRRKVYKYLFIYLQLPALCLYFFNSIGKEDNEAVRRNEVNGRKL